MNIRLPRFALSAFTLAFGFYHAVLGLLNLSGYGQPNMAHIAIALYSLALVLAVASYPGLKLRDGVAWIVVTIAILVPFLVTTALAGLAPTGYTTWHVAGVATLMAILTVRQHPVMAWLGISFLIAQTITWGGFGVLFTSGVFGAFLLVLAAQATSSLLAASTKAAQEFRDKSITTDAQTAANSAARAERQKRVQQTLSQALPLLQRVVEAGGDLSPQERQQAALTENELRDKIRGKELDHPVLNAEVRAARLRGVEVQLLDDGGLADLSRVDRDELLYKVAQSLESVRSGKVVIRAAAGERWSLTVTALRKGEEKPDLFLRL